MYCWVNKKIWNYIVVLDYNNGCVELRSSYKNAAIQVNVQINTIIQKNLKFLKSSHLKSQSHNQTHNLTQNILISPHFTHTTVRLCAMQVKLNSIFTFFNPRVKNSLNPRFCLIFPNGHSTVSFRFLY